jgi:hypothetical protein
MKEEFPEMNRLRTFLAGLLLVPVLAVASPLSSKADNAGLSPSKPVADVCYVYYMGRWVAFPC